MDGTDIHPLLFLLFLGVYLVNALGNLSMVVLVRSDAALRSPMYYFLGHLSLVDICFTTVTVPRLLAGLLHPGQAVSFRGCFAQMYFFVALGITESYLLAAMSYDRAAAVCRPLHYAAVMSPGRCAALAAASWALAHLHSLLHMLLISRLSYPRAAPVRHFFCDMTVMLSLATSDTSAAETAIFSEGLAVVLTPLLLVALSYARILAAVLGPAPRLLHLRGPPAGGVAFLRLHPLRLLPAIVCLLRPLRPPGQRGLCGGYPDPEPFHLQPAQ